MHTDITVIYIQCVLYYYTAPYFFLVLDHADATDWFFFFLAIVATSNLVGINENNFSVEIFCLVPALISI